MAWWKRKLALALGRYTACALRLSAKKDSKSEYTSKRETTAPCRRMCRCAIHSLVICCELNVPRPAYGLGLLQLPLHRASADISPTKSGL
ncbi:hypothetical protein COO60DRAFT_1507716 [Scenedesmus sp. NREL 46B-D3]|nr:hypothetical protein COO60DRAFT_1507716 [Scenedesmus sp. NREL 46B-D3]